VNDLTTFKIGTIVFIITNDENNLTTVEEAVITGVQNEFYLCDVTEPKIIIRSRYRMPSELYVTRHEAQAALDYLHNYIAYRMASHNHRMK
jgi:hypothetical protein